MSRPRNGEHDDEHVAGERNEEHQVGLVEAPGVEPARAVLRIAALSSADAR